MTEKNQQKTVEVTGTDNLHLKPSDHFPSQTSSPIDQGNETSYEVIEETAKFLLERTKIRPKIAIICGSGLGHLADALIETDVFPYEEIPHFPITTVQGHTGRMTFGRLNGVGVMCMQGRFHFYEGYSLAKCTMPVRVMKLCGCELLIVTNAAGGLNANYKLGDVMMVKDHINIMGFAGNNPLQGPNDLRFGPRFPNMNKAYDPELIKVGNELAGEMGMAKDIHTGVYCCVAGPSYETVAEIRMWKILGVDTIGMSTVYEVLTARHLDMKVFAFSLITNVCVTEYETDDHANHQEVMSIADEKTKMLTEFVSKFVGKVHEKFHTN